MLRRPPELAPARLRALANAIDLVVSMAPLGALFWRRPEWARRTGARGAFRLVGLALMLGHRTHRSPGERIVGLRTADGRTGAPPTVAAVLRRWTLQTARELVSRRVTAPAFRAGQDAQAQLATRDQTAQLDPEERRRLGRQAARGCLLTVALASVQLLAGAIVRRRRRAAGYPPATVTLRSR